MSNDQINILLIEDAPKDAGLFQMMLSKVRALGYAIERKRAEKASRESLGLIERAKKEWESTVDSLPQFVGLLDRKGHIIRTNRTVEHWGLARVTEVKGREVHPLFHPDCTDPACYLASSWSQAWAELRQGHAVEWEAEDKVLRRHLYFQIRPISTQTKKTNIATASFGAIVVQDMTKRKRAEEALQKAHEELEQRVKERTADLAQANLALRQEIADRKWAEMENARLYAETASRARELTILNKAGQAITANLHLDDVFYVFCAHAARLLPYDHMSVTLVEGNNIRVAYAVGEDEITWPVGATLPRETSAIGWVVARGQPLLRNNISNDTRFADSKQLAAMGVRSNLIIPLRVKGQIIGTWNLGSRQICAYQADDLEIIQSMADQLAIAIENARLFEQVQLGRKQLRRLAQQIVSAQEEERQRLSYELHDEAGQTLTALKLWLELIQIELPPEAEILYERLGEAVNLTATLMEQLRSIARDLRPPALDVAGLNDVLEDHCRDFAQRTRLIIDYSGMELPPLSDPAMTCLYRFLQEALTNVAKHAQAHHVRVELQADAHTVNLTVEDDGLGFEQEVEAVIAAQLKGIGLLGIQERLELLGGWLEVESQPGQGARLTVHLPLEES